MKLGDPLPRRGFLGLVGAIVSGAPLARLVPEVVTAQNWISLAPGAGSGIAASAVAVPGNTSNVAEWLKRIYATKEERIYATKDLAPYQNEPIFEDAFEDDPPQGSPLWSVPIDVTSPRSRHR